MKLSIFWLALSTLLPLAGACTAHRPVQAGSSPSAIVEMHFHSFQPQVVTIRAGQTVLWKNTSLIWHTATADPRQAKRPEDVSLPEGAEAFDSGKVVAGDSFSHTFTVPGTYRYFCRPHELKGMVGQVVVTPAPQPAQPGRAAPR
jgi:plastocyanin